MRCGGRRELVGHAPFALLFLPDVLVQHGRGCLAQMIDACGQLPDKANVIAVEEVPMERVHMYGVVGVGKPQRRRPSRSPRWWRSRRATEAPSNLIITGRYILQPEIPASSPTQTVAPVARSSFTDAMTAWRSSSPSTGSSSRAAASTAAARSASCAANVAYALAREDIAPASGRS